MRHSVKTSKFKTASARLGLSFSSSLAAFLVAAALCVAACDSVEEEPPEKTVPSNRAPSASFAFSPEQPDAGAEVTFDASASSDPDGEILLYEWVFRSSDTTSATGVEVTRSFEGDENVRVSLTVTDSGGENVREKTASTSKTVSFSGTAPPEEAPPSADFEITSSGGEAYALSETVFDASPSSPGVPADGIARYEWDFDADGETDAEGREASHEFESRGTYEVSLSVTDESGRSGAVSRDIEVQLPEENLAPTASLELPYGAGPYYAVLDTVLLDASGTTDPNEDELSYAWYKDGERVSGSDLPDMTFTPENPGLTEFKVVATDPSGASSEASVTVEAAPLRQEAPFSEEAASFVEEVFSTEGNFRTYKWLRDIHYSIKGEVSDKRRAKIEQVMEAVDRLVGSGVSVYEASSSGETPNMTFEYVPDGSIDSEGNTDIDQDVYGLCRYNIVGGYDIVSTEILLTESSRTRTLHHEVGHAIGMFKHRSPGHSDSVMQTGFGLGQTDITAFTGLDIEAISAVYHPEVENALRSWDAADVIRGL